MKINNESLNLNLLLIRVADSITFFIAIATIREPKYSIRLLRLVTTPWQSYFFMYVFGKCFTK